MEHIIALIEQSHKGDKKARDRLVEENLGLVWSIVKRFAKRGHELEDLFQIGSIGLMKAIDKFDTSFQVKFSTYAVPLISGEIKRFLRDDGMIKVSRTLKEQAVKIKQAREAFGRAHGREPTLEEVADALGMDREDVIMAMEADSEVESLNKTIYQGEGSEIYLIDKLVEKGNDNETLINRMVVKSLIDSLEEKERRLIILRFYLCKTQTEIARELGISQVQVSRLEKRILKSMREKI